MTIEPAHQIRKEVRQLRRNLPSSIQVRDAQRVLLRLIDHPKVQQAKNIALSLAFDGEINTLPFIKWCWANNKQVYLPVVHPFSKGQLLFLHYSKDTKMLKNQYGIAEPQLDQRFICPVKQLDLIFTPLVAFDKQGNRMGMGGGYYDRMLAPWFLDQKGPYPIGLAHDCQQVDDLPTQPWDVPLPEIISPSKHYLFTAKN